MIRKPKNYMDNLVSYIINNLKKGYTKESLKWALVGQGHSKIEVEKAMKLVDEKLAETAPVLQTKPEINYEVVEPKSAPEENKSFFRRLFG